MPELQAILGKVVLHKVNGEKDDGPARRQEFKVHGYPTFVLLRADGETLERWIGYGEAKDFVGRLDGALKDPTTIEEKRARYTTSPTWGDAERLGVYHESCDEYIAAARYYREAQAKAKEGNRDLRFSIFDAVASGAREGQFTLDEVKQSADAALAYEGRTADEVVSVARMTTSLGRKLQNRDIMVPYLELAMQVTEGSTDEKLVKARRGLRADHALFVTKDPEKAVAFKKEGMTEGWMETSDGLNSFAWWCFENRVNLEEADALARKGVTLASDGPGKAAILDTAAEICNARGNCKDAIVLIEQAIQADPGNEYYVKQRDRFRKILAES